MKKNFLYAVIIFSILTTHIFAGHPEHEIFCDKTVEGIITPTTCGFGGCRSTGEITCTDGEWTEDTCVPGTPETEICGDSIDQDCNGSDLICDDDTDGTTDDDSDDTIDDTTDNDIDDNIDNDGDGGGCFINNIVH